MKVNCNIYFNNRCLQENLTPRFLTIKINREQITPGSRRCLSRLKSLMLKDEIRLQYRKLYYLDIRLKSMYDLLKEVWPFIVLNNFLHDLDTLINFQHTNKMRTLNKKLQALKTIKPNQSQSIHDHFVNFHTPLINYSDCVFTVEEVELLKKGIKFNPLIKNNNSYKNNLELLAVETESILQNFDLANKDLLRNDVINLLKKEKENINLPNNTLTSGSYNDKLIKSISIKIKNNDLILTKADKGNCLIVMNRFDYLSKVYNFLNTNDFTTINNPLNKFNTKFKNVLKNSKCLITPTLFNKFKPDHKLIPRLYGLLKIHKSDVYDEMQIRPVVSFVNSPTYYTSKWLNDILKEHYKDYFIHTVKNSVQLIEKIKDVHVTDTDYLVSLDVSNLFTNVPIPEVLE